MMNAAMGMATEAKLLDVEKMPAHSLVESSSMTNFMPEEEASICPLLSSNTINTIAPLTFSHPLTLCNNIETDDSHDARNLCCLEDRKTDSCSSFGSSSGLAINVPEDASSTLFNKHTNYKHLQPSSPVHLEEHHNGHGTFGCPASMGGDTPSFVAWNWPLIRKCTFFAFISVVLAMCAVVVAMIASLPKTCNPKTAWYHGGVFYEIFPASFQDTNDDGFGDLRGISKRIDYLSELGVSGIRLNSIFPSKHYPDDFHNVTTLLSIAPVLGTENDLQQLILGLHRRNISLMMDLPVHPLLLQLDQLKATVENNKNSSDQAGEYFTKNTITEALRHWTQLNVDGFYLKGVEHLNDKDSLRYHLREWKSIIGPNRVLIVNENILNVVGGKNSSIWQWIDLVDVYLETMNHSIESIQSRIQSVLTSEISPSGTNEVWIQWSIGGEGHPRFTCPTTHNNNGNGQYSLAITLLQLMLPGTPNIFYGDEIALQAAALGDVKDRDHQANWDLQQLGVMRWMTSSAPHDSGHISNVQKILPWMPTPYRVHFENIPVITNMILLRDNCPSIYKNAICKQNAILPNTILKRPIPAPNSDILIIERVYPRRNMIVAISNLGEQSMSIDLSSMYYSGVVQLYPSLSQQRIYFNKFEINAKQTIIVKLDK